MTSTFTNPVKISLLTDAEANYPKWAFKIKGSAMKKAGFAHILKLVLHFCLATESFFILFLFFKFKNILHVDHHAWPGADGLKPTAKSLRQEIKSPKAKAFIISFERENNNAGCRREPVTGGKLFHNFKKII